MGTLSGQIHLDFRSSEPIYLQIVRQVEKLLHDGILKPGDQLPTVRQLAIDLRINFSTVARAYHVLDEQKLISTQRGRGTYIWDDVDLGSIADRKTLQAKTKLERSQALGRLVRSFIDEAQKSGASLDEIEQSIQHGIASRR